MSKTSLLKSDNEQEKLFPFVFTRVMWKTNKLRHVKKVSVDKKTLIVFLNVWDFSFPHCARKNVG